ncbi:MAG: hypothetical protein ABI877_05860 [Gemmatimonadaceae bacterium]
MSGTVANGSVASDHSNAYLSSTIDLASFGLNRVINANLIPGDNWRLAGYATYSFGYETRSEAGGDIGVEVMNNAAVNAAFASIPAARESQRGVRFDFQASWIQFVARHVPALPITRYDFQKHR